MNFRWQSLVAHCDSFFCVIFSVRASRPVAGWGRHRTPISGLYLCGAGTHPGGGVMGSPGRNAARIVGYEFAKNGGK